MKKTPAEFNGSVFATETVRVFEDNFDFELDVGASPCLSKERSSDEESFSSSTDLLQRSSTSQRSLSEQLSNSGTVLPCLDAESSEILVDLDAAFVASPSPSISSLSSHQQEFIPMPNPLSFALEEETCRVAIGVSDQSLPFDYDSSVLNSLSSGETRRQAIGVTGTSEVLDQSPDSDCSLTADSSDLPDPLRFGMYIPELVENDIRLTAEVINLSSIPLSVEQLHALNLLVKFRQTPHKAPFLELVSASECAAHLLEESDSLSAEKFRTQCATVIRNATIPKPNLTKRVRWVLRELSKHEKLVVTTADKGGKVVILDDLQYTEMCLAHLSDLAYELVKSFGSGRAKVTISNFSTGLFSTNFINADPSDRLLRSQCQQLTEILNKLVRTQDLSAKERHALIPGQPYSGTLPRFYGLPKVHKIGILKLRPIITTFGHYSENVALLLKRILNLLLWGTTAVGNSYEFVHLLEQTDLQLSDMILSFDVVSLFMLVPVRDSLRIIEQRLQELSDIPFNPVHEITSLSNHGIMTLLEHVLAHCYFTWDSTLYRQCSSLPMGGRLSPIIANLFMEELEHQVLCTALIIPKIYFCYVDDMFIVWDQNKGSYVPFLELMNSQHPEISLTAEEENNGVLAFLDVEVTRPTVHVQPELSRPMQIDIHHKPTHTGRYLHFKSSHPLKLKRTMVRGLWL